MADESNRNAAPRSWRRNDGRTQCACGWRCSSRRRRWRRLRCASRTASRWTSRRWSWGSRRWGGGGRKFFRRKKVCKFCVEKIDGINYKDVRLLSGFVSEAGKIVPRRLTGVCTPHQRRLADAIKQARNIALLPFGGR